MHVGLGLRSEALAAIDRHVHWGKYAHRLRAAVPEDFETTATWCSGLPAKNARGYLMFFAASSDSISLAVSGNDSACPRPLVPVPFARSSGVRPLASFAVRSAPFSARNFTNAVKPRCAAPWIAV